MLFYFDLNCEQLLSGGEAAASILSEVLRAHRRGHHLVVMERETCKGLLSSYPCNALEAATLRQLGNEYTQTFSLLTRAKYYVAIKSAEVMPRKIDARRIEIGLNALSRSKALEQPSTSSQRF